ncbi:MAG: helix-turn-helix domain-containing protein [Flavobacteriales bacterium]|nr:helix-turn-helix domain-containing protein [Flavobacteriales bacterium]
MNKLEDIKRPTKEEQELAMASYDALAATLKQLKDENPEIEIEETKELIKVPLNALKLLAQVLKAMSKGNPISIVPVAAEMTTQAAADIIGCSRPHLVKLLEEGVIPFSKVGRHRRVRIEDVVAYKKQMKEKQRQALIEMMRTDEDYGLYDS